MCVEVLLTLGDDKRDGGKWKSQFVNQKDDDGMTALAKATKRAAEAIVEAGDKNEPEMLALANDRIEMIRLLVGCPCVDVTSCDHSLWSALAWCIPQKLSGGSSSDALSPEVVGSLADIMKVCTGRVNGAAGTELGLH